MGLSEWLDDPVSHGEPCGERRPSEGPRSEPEDSPINARKRSRSRSEKNRGLLRKGEFVFGNHPRLAHPQLGVAHLLDNDGGVGERLRQNQPGLGVGVRVSTLMDLPFHSGTSPFCPQVEGASSGQVDAPTATLWTCSAAGQVRPLPISPVFLAGNHHWPPPEHSTSTPSPLGCSGGVRTIDLRKPVILNFPQAWKSLPS